MSPFSTPSAKLETLSLSENCISWRYCGSFSVFFLFLFFMNLWIFYACSPLHVDLYTFPQNSWNFPLGCSSSWLGCAPPKICHWTLRYWSHLANQFYMAVYFLFGIYYFLFRICYNFFYCYFIVQTYVYILRL